MTIYNTISKEEVEKEIDEAEKLKEIRSHRAGDYCNGIIAALEWILGQEEPPTNMLK